MEHITPIMDKNQELAFRAFMNFNIIEEPEPCIFGFNQYYYEFEELTGLEFLKIIKWEMNHVHS